MLVSKSWCEDTAEEIIWEFENLLCKKDIKIENENAEDNKFEDKDAPINIKDYSKLKEEIVKQLIALVEYVEHEKEYVA